MNNNKGNININTTSSSQISPGQGRTHNSDINDNELITNRFLWIVLNDIIYPDVLFYSVTAIGLILLAYGIMYHFYLYDSNFIPIKAHIVEAACDRVIINRRRDEYYCLMTIEYVVDGKTISNTLQTNGNNMYYVGTDLSIYVNRNNPVDMYIPFISQRLSVILLVSFGIVLILIASSIKFLHI
jgi:hypothetical protein